jgi:hypothetical protein
MRFILGLLIGYSIRGKQRALIATLATIAFIVFILIPGIALSLLAVSVHRERLSRPPQTTVPTVIGLTHYNAELRLRAVHLNLRVLARYDAPLDSGVIVFQTPQAGERVDYQTTVGVTSLPQKENHQAQKDRPMKVRIVGGGTRNLGATRYKIEWLVIKPDVNTEDGIDPDTDTDTYIEYRPEQDAAIRRAQEIFTTTNNLCWNVVIVTKQIVVWLFRAG